MHAKHLRAPAQFFSLQCVELDKQEAFSPVKEKSRTVGTTGYDMIAKYAGCLIATTFLLSSAGSNAVMAQDQCVWEKRAALPAPVQRYLSYIFQKPDDRYRPFRFQPSDYLENDLKDVSRRVEEWEDVDTSRPFALYQYQSSFPKGLKWKDATTVVNSPFNGYLRLARGMSEYLLDNYDGSEFTKLGVASFIGFNSGLHASPEEQVKSIVKMNPERFQAGNLSLEKAGGCLVASQMESDRLVALLTIYDGQPATDDASRASDFLRCRDRHYARFLGLPYWPNAVAYSKSVTPIRAPDYGYGQRPPPPGLSVKPKSRAAADNKFARLSGGSQRQTSDDLLSPAWELQGSEGAMQIVALEGSSDFAGVCRIAMETLYQRWPFGAQQWADEQLGK